MFFFFPPFPPLREVILLSVKLTNHNNSQISSTMQNQAFSSRDMGNHHKHWGSGWGGKKANAPRSLCKCKISYSNIKYKVNKDYRNHLYNTSLPKLIQLLCGQAVFGTLNSLTPQHILLFLNQIVAPQKKKKKEGKRKTIYISCSLSP